MKKVKPVARTLAAGFTMAFGAVLVAIQRGTGTSLSAQFLQTLRIRSADVVDLP